MPLCGNLETAPRMGKRYLQDLVSFNNGLKAQSNDVPKRKTKNISFKYRLTPSQGLSTVQDL